ncbi:MAG: hypothetical protein LBO79_08090, partial [Zoogloeaceae bacterium]|nr:hypothetical protein [Zoogloeaceae bacterium]
QRARKMFDARGEITVIIAQQNAHISRLRMPTNQPTNTINGKPASHRFRWTAPSQPPRCLRRKLYGDSQTAAQKSMETETPLDII